jgi:hypothetical protein
MRFIAALLLLACAPAFAQDPLPTINVGEQYVLTWLQEPLCTNGAPIAECPVGGYHVQIEREQRLQEWINVSATHMGPTVRSYTWTANGGGTTCFRVQVLNSAAYEQSPPSNVKCVRVLVPLKPGTKPPILSSSKD